MRFALQACVFFGFGQTPQELWVQHVAGSDSLDDWAIKVDVHGHIFVAGNTQKSASDSFQGQVIYHVVSV